MSASVDSIILFDFFYDRINTQTKAVKLYNCFVENADSIDVGKLSPKDLVMEDQYEMFLFSYKENKTDFITGVILDTVESLRIGFYKNSDRKDLFEIILQSLREQNWDLSAVVLFEFQWLPNSIYVCYNDKIYYVVNGKLTNAAPFFKTLSGSEDKYKLEPGMTYMKRYPEKYGEAIEAIEEAQRNGGKKYSNGVKATRYQR